MSGNYSPFLNMNISAVILNSTFNSTFEYEDPVVKLINIISSSDTINYIVYTVCITLFVTHGLPFIGATLFMTLNYGGSLIIFYAYCLKYRLKNGKEGLDEDATRKAIHKWWIWVTNIWFGFEMIGVEKVPPNESVMIISMHGVASAPVGSASAIWFKLRHHVPYGVIDKHHANHPMLQKYAKLFNFGAWSREECVKILQEGSDIIIMPGGALELKHSDSNYNIVWGDRKGFAHVAKQAKAIIVPTVCVNLNEAFWIPFPFKYFVRSKFAPKRFAIAVGGLPVKLTAIMGDPIRCDESKSVDDIFNETLNSIQQLIAMYQRVPGNKFYALLDRFRKVKPRSNPYT